MFSSKSTSTCGAVWSSGKQTQRPSCAASDGVAAAIEVARYTEILNRGGSTITSTGGCSFRGNEPEPDAFEKEEMRQRS